MSRILILLAALVVLTACGALAYVVLHQPGSTPAPDATAAATEPLPAPAPAPSAEPAAPPPAVTAAPEPYLTPCVAETAKAPLTRDQLAALVDKLSPDDFAKLDKAANKRDYARRMDDFKYALPSDRFLSSKKLHLTPDQEQKIRAIKDAMKPQMDQALAPVRAQFAQWDTRGQALWKSVTIEGQSDPAFQAQVKAESDNYNEITKLQAAITAPLDQQFMNQVRPLLSPDQQQAYDASAAAAAELQKSGGKWHTVPGGSGNTFQLNLGN